MLTQAQVDALDCDTLSRDHALRRRIIPVLRAFFAGSKPDFDPAMDDEDLMGYAKAKYHDHPFRAEESREESKELFRRFDCLHQVPDFVCSYFKVALTAQQPQPRAA